MASRTQRKATRVHRRRAKPRGLVRVEVLAPARDAGVIRAVAETLREGQKEAEALRSTLAKLLISPEVESAFDIFGSDLPDGVFAGVFDQQQRERHWRAVDL